MQTKSQPHSPIATEHYRAQSHNNNTPPTHTLAHPPATTSALARPRLGEPAAAKPAPALRCLYTNSTSLNSSKVAVPCSNSSVTVNDLTLSLSQKHCSTSSRPTTSANAFNRQPQRQLPPPTRLSSYIL